jgi:hypothetical protein
MVVRFVNLLVSSLSFHPLLFTQSSSVPDAIWWMKSIAWIIVDLPEPFSPTRHEKVGKEPSGGKGGKWNSTRDLKLSMSNCLSIISTPPSESIKELFK